MLAMLLAITGSQKTTKTTTITTTTTIGKATAKVLKQKVYPREKLSLLLFRLKLFNVVAILVVVAVIVVAVAVA